MGKQMIYGEKVHCLYAEDRVFLSDYCLQCGYHNNHDEVSVDCAFGEHEDQLPWDVLDEAWAKELREERERRQASPAASSDGHTDAEEEAPTCLA